MPISLLQKSREGEKPTETPYSHTDDCCLSHETKRRRKKKIVGGGGGGGLLAIQNQPPGRMSIYTHAGRRFIYTIHAACVKSCRKGWRNGGGGGGGGSCALKPQLLKLHDGMYRQRRKICDSALGKMPVEKKKKKKKKTGRRGRSRKSPHAQHHKASTTNAHQAQFSTIHNENFVNLVFTAPPTPPPAPLHPRPNQFILCVCVCVVLFCFETVPVKGYHCIYSQNHGQLQHVTRNIDSQYDSDDQSLTHRKSK